MSEPSHWFTPAFRKSSGSAASIASNGARNTSWAYLPLARMPSPRYAYVMTSDLSMKRTAHA